MDGNTRGGGHSEALKSYNLGKTLGAGTFGKVMIAEHKLTGRKVAIKILNRHKMKTMEMEEKGWQDKGCSLLVLNPWLLSVFITEQSHDG